MSEVTFDLMTSKLFKIKEIFGRLEPARFSEVMSDPLLLLLDDIVSSVAKTYMPSVWESMPQEVKDDLVLTADQETGIFLTEFMADMQEHIEDVVDIKHMSVTFCVANKHLIVKIFQECGEHEFIFIRRSGFYFGFLFGCTCFWHQWNHCNYNCNFMHQYPHKTCLFTVTVAQMAVWFFYAEDWVLPICGFAVGWFTNYVALKVSYLLDNKSFPYIHARPTPHMI
jgi:hypothetical protein